MASLRERAFGGVAPWWSPPREADVPVPIWFHWGGCVIGSAREWLRTVVIPDYRLPPEPPFPAVLDDALAVTGALLAEAAALGGPRANVAAGGESARGNLAALAALHLPGLAHQTLAYPVLDAATTQPSSATMATGYMQTLSMMEWFVRLYVGDHEQADRRTTTLHAPAEAFHNGGPAHVAIADYDPLSDEGEAYARRLREAGVPVIMSLYEGQMDGPFIMERQSPPAPSPCKKR